MIGQAGRRVTGAGQRQARHAWRDELVADGFEIWIGISRLLARLQALPHERASPVKRASGGRQARRKRA